MGVLVPLVESRTLIYDVLPDLEEVVEFLQNAGVVSAVFRRGVCRSENRFHLFPYAVEESTGLL